MNESTFEKHRNIFIEQSRIHRPEFINYYNFPCLNEDTKVSDFDPHYLYHVSWAIKKIWQTMPEMHVDVSSSLNFCSSIAAFTKTTFIDYRPVSIHIDNLSCISGDLCDEDQWKGRDYESLSCMHVVEHIGLGRYGDEININGDICAIDNLIDSLRSGGRLLFVVPVGIPEIYFNAHRVYSASWISAFFSKKCKLNEFYLIPSNPKIKPLINVDLVTADQFSYACGCFEFMKI